MIKLNKSYQIILFGLFLVFLFSGTTFAAQPDAVKRGTTMQIGNVSWLTEQNSMEQLTAIAIKEKKPILMVFSATWCKPCQEIKKDVFAVDDFKKVAALVIPVYIEQTDPKSKPFIAQNKVSVFPTFRLFSPEGKVLDTGRPNRTVDGFLSWIRDVKSGKIKPREKKLQMGNVSFYTEKNSLQDMLAIAAKENKPILAFFSYKTSRKFSPMDRRMFSQDEFSEVAKEVILLNVGEGEPEAGEYVKKYRFRLFPDYKMISTDGIELESHSSFFKSAKELLDWVRDIKAGNNYHQLSLKLKKEPDNRELIARIAEKTPISQKDLLPDLYRRIIKLNPDTKDPLTHKAYEEVLRLIFHDFNFNQDQERQRRVAESNADVLYTVLKAYYPDKLEHSLAKRRGFPIFIGYLTALGKHDEALTYFDDFLKLPPSNTSSLTDSKTYQEALSALLYAERFKEADQWLKKATELILNSPRADRMKRMAVYQIGYLYDSFIRYYAGKNDYASAEKYLRAGLRVFSEQKQDRLGEMYKRRYKTWYGLLAEDEIKSLEEKLKTSNPLEKLESSLSLARLYAARKQTEKAKKLLSGILDGTAIPASISQEKRSSIISMAIRAMVFKKIVDQKTIAAAEKLLKANENFKNLDLMARVHGALKDYKKAILLMEKALAAAEKATEKIHYRILEASEKQLSEWKRTLN